MTNIDSMEKHLDFMSHVYYLAQMCFFSINVNMINQIIQYTCYVSLVLKLVIECKVTCTLRDLRNF